MSTGLHSSFGLRSDIHNYHTRNKSDYNQTRNKVFLIAQFEQPDQFCGILLKWSSQKCKIHLSNFEKGKKKTNKQTNKKTLKDSSISTYN